MEIAMELEYFESAYLGPVVHKQIANALKINFSTRLFSESTMDIISSEIQLINWIRNFKKLF